MTPQMHFLVFAGQFARAKENLQLGSWIQGRAVE